MVDFSCRVYDVTNLFASEKKWWLASCVWGNCFKLFIWLAVDSRSLCTSSRRTLLAHQTEWICILFFPFELSWLEIGFDFVFQAESRANVQAFTSSSFEDLIFSPLLLILLLIVYSMKIIQSRVTSHTNPSIALEQSFFTLFNVKLIQQTFNTRKAAKCLFKDRRVERKSQRSSRGRIFA